MNRRRVYFIKPIGMEGPVKIGCSFSPDGRRQTLETWSPFPLEIVAEIEGNYDLEARFHSLFVDSYRGREWFDVTPELQAVIRQINDGTFDIASLPGEVCSLQRFRKSRDNSYVTPGWRYKRSVLQRYYRRKHLTYDNFYLPVLRMIGTGDGDERWLAHRDQIEAFIVECEAAA